MNLHKRYINGEYEKVYQDIDELGKKAFSSTYFPEIDKVLIETFERVAFNLEIIHSELIKIDYHFCEESGVKKPLENTKRFIDEVRRKYFGYCVYSVIVRVFL